MDVKQDVDLTVVLDDLLHLLRLHHVHDDLHTVHLQEELVKYLVLSLLLLQHHLSTGLSQDYLLLLQEPHHQSQGHQDVLQDYPLVYHQQVPQYLLQQP